MATKTTINISPKVLTYLLTGLGTSAVLGAASGVDEHTFDFLGPWSTVAKLAFTVLISAAAGWLKREHDTASTDAPPASSVPVAPELPPVPLVPQTADQIINGTDVHTVTPVA